jgi:methionyl-tRNA synthetase
VLTNFEGQLPASASAYGESETEVIATAARVHENVMKWIAEVKLSQVVEEIMSLVRTVNRYLEIKAPWKLAKDPAKRDELATVLFVSAEAVRVSLCFLWPVMPAKTQEGLAMMGTRFTGKNDLVWGIFKGGETFGKGEPLFPRIEMEKSEEPAPVPKNAQNKPLPAADVPAVMDLRVARIIDVKNHPDAQSLYVLQVDAGEGTPRTICSGLKKSYTAEALLNRTIILFANLKPAPLRGIMSAGMLLAGDGENETAILLVPPATAKIGDRALFKGIKPGEARELKVKDFEKIIISVQGKEVLCNERHLEVNGIAVTCDALDNASVH